MYNIKRGEIYYANLGENIGSEQNGIRPVVIIQNDLGNKYSNTVIVLPVTSKSKTNLPVHVIFDGTNYGLDKKSIILIEQIRTLDKKRLMNKVGKLDNKILDKIKKALKLSFNIRFEF